VLVTGGAGYIGSHTCLELLAAGHEVTVVDNLSNASPEAVKRVERLTGRALPLHVVDLLELPALERVFAGTHPHAVLHFAGLKAVGESVQEPLRYYANNVTGTLNLLECMKRQGVARLVFSSSATVYGEAGAVPVTEDMPLDPKSPYGRTKRIVEELCFDVAQAQRGWHIALLRYFNPVGAHESGEIGEDPRGAPNNLMPHLLQVAVGRRPELQVFGHDYPTTDGTGVRDYIHVVDVAQGHVKALDALPSLEGCVPLNLGTGRPVSVLEMISAFGKACGRQVAYTLSARRPGDVAVSYANPQRATALLGWSAQRGLDAMCTDAWRWALNNPNGYAKTPSPP
jgi:UDP-glucose 4-epimerase